MKSKSYVEELLERALATNNMLQKDIEGNRPYATQDYVLERLHNVEKIIISVLDRVQLEDENP